jgi:hypothetical protein
MRSALVSGGAGGAPQCICTGSAPPAARAARPDPVQAPGLRPRLGSVCYVMIVIKQYPHKQTTLIM